MRVLLACEKWYPFHLNTLIEKNRDLSGDQKAGQEGCQWNGNIRAGTQGAKRAFTSGSTEEAEQED